MGNDALMTQAASRSVLRQRDPVAEVRGLLKQMGPEMLAALPATVRLTPERLGRIAVTTIRLNPGLLECSTASLIGALIQCAQLGLEPNPQTGHAYLVPFKRSKKRPDGSWERWTECQFILGYRGMVELARRSGAVSFIESHVVYENDTFDVTYGTSARLTYVPCLKGPRGEPFAVYAYARLRDGSEVFETMTVEDVDAIRERSKAKDSGPWVSDWAMMARKTVIRRLFKILPSSVENLDAEAADGSVVAGLDIGKTIEVKRVDEDRIDLPEVEFPANVDEPAPADDLPEPFGEGA